MFILGFDDKSAFAYFRNKQNVHETRKRANSHESQLIKYRKYISVGPRTNNSTALTQKSVIKNKTE